eukprot:scaffold336_cov196-Amphora_coffeaeformis.AAC.20
MGLPSSSNKARGAMRWRFFGSSTGASSFRAEEEEDAVIGEFVSLVEEVGTIGLLLLVSRGGGGGRKKYDDSVVVVVVADAEALVRPEPPAGCGEIM